MRRNKAGILSAGGFLFIIGLSTPGGAAHAPAHAENRAGQAGMHGRQSSIEAEDALIDKFESEAVGERRQQAKPVLQCRGLLETLPRTTDPAVQSARDTLLLLVRVAEVTVLGDLDYPKRISKAEVQAHLREGAAWAREGGKEARMAICQPAAAAAMEVRLAIERQTKVDEPTSSRSQLRSHLECAAAIDAETSDEGPITPADVQAILPALSLSEIEAMMVGGIPQDELGRIQAAVTAKHIARSSANAKKAADCIAEYRALKAYDVGLK